MLIGRLCDSACNRHACVIWCVFRGKKVWTSFLVRLHACCKCDWWCWKQDCVKEWEAESSTELNDVCACLFSDNDKPWAVSLVNERRWKSDNEKEFDQLQACRWLLTHPTSCSPGKNLLPVISWPSVWAKHLHFKFKPKAKREREKRGR